MSQSAFQLEIPYIRTEPLDHLWGALFPSGFDLRKSISHCPRLSKEKSILRGREWKIYGIWRWMHAAQRCLENLEITEEDERPGSAENRVENPGALDSSTLLSMVTENPRAWETMQKNHFFVLDRLFD